MVSYKKKMEKKILVTTSGDNMERATVSNARGQL